MPISPLYVNELHRPLNITWVDDSGAALDLTSATLTVRFSGVTTSASFLGAGTFNVTSPTTGKFTYTLAASDVQSPGTWSLQFIATYADTTKQFSDPVPLSVLADL